MSTGAPTAARRRWDARRTGSVSARGLETAPCGSSLPGGPGGHLEVRRSGSRGQRPGLAERGRSLRHTRKTATAPLHRPLSHIGGGAVPPRQQFSSLIVFWSGWRSVRGAQGRFLAGEVSRAGGCAAGASHVAAAFGLLPAERLSPVVSHHLEGPTIRLMDDSSGRGVVFGDPGAARSRGARPATANRRSGPFA